MFNTAEELFSYMQIKNKSLIEAIIENETALTGHSREEIESRLWERFGVMKNSAFKALNSPQKTLGSMIEGDSMRLNSYAESGKALTGGTLARAMAMALSCSEVNASMGRICAAPTAGSCGIIPGVILSIAEEYCASKEKITDALLISAAVGAMITKNATVSGAEGGCQAECGAAAAMAAASAVYLRGGAAEMCFNAASIALQNIMGLICDPVAGLVETPCAKRNASGAANAFCSADMALSGIDPVIPFDETVGALYKVGKALPVSLRETGAGGIAATKTGLYLKKKIFGIEQHQK